MPVPPIKPTRIPHGPETEVVVSAVPDPAHEGRYVVDLRLERRGPLGADADPATPGPYVPTAAGLRLSASVVPVLVEALQRMTKRVAEAQVWAPTPEDAP
jgi:hypothetical protein